MKKLILLSAIAIVVLAQTSKAQDSKQNQPNQPTFQLNPNKPLTLSVSLPIGYVETYLLVEQNGGLQAIENSDKLTGQQINQIKQVYRLVKDSINNQLVRNYNSIFISERTKFSADTAKKQHQK